MMKRWMSIVLILLVFQSAVIGANDFSDCVAYYGFENAWDDGTTAGTNDLTGANGVSFDSGTKHDGSYSAKFEYANMEVAYRLDSGLSSDFPCKNGTTNRVFSLWAWVYPNIVATSSGTAYTIAAKYRAATDKRSWLFGNAYITGTSNRWSFWGGQSTTYQAIGLVPTSAITTGKWYFVGVSVDADGDVLLFAYDGTNTDTATGTLTESLPITDSIFSIGARKNAAGTDYDLGWDGFIDSVGICDWALSASEFSEIRDGTWDGLQEEPSFSQIIARRRRN